MMKKAIEWSRRSIEWIRSLVGGRSPENSLSAASRRQELRVFILGDMKPKGSYTDDTSTYVTRNNTSQLSRIIGGAVSDLAKKNRVPSEQSIEVTAPDDSARSQIVSAVLSQIERSDLIVVDISYESPSVMYELAAVNSLGTPYILVTSKNVLPFYLMQNRAILNFSFSDVFDPGEESHRVLRERIFANYQSSDGVGFGESILSQYFDGIPIVNISGPASAAIGYHVNTLARFGAQSSGFLVKPVKVARDGEFAESIEELRLSALVVVMPDLTKHTNLDDARLDLEEGLRRVGLSTMSASILEKDSSGNWNSLGFGAMMLEQDPTIVLDIPRTIYPLSNVPRVHVATRQEPLLSGAAGRRRLLRRLVREFEAIVFWSMRRESERSDGGWKKIHFVDHEMAPEFLRNFVADKQARGG
ncbi:hypothetical protein SAMN04488105_110232 [Salipiger thiooxidans]|uniref:Prokaryotic STING domain-containing protein n=1 Tax=Salipiger thiooxidans TaxID=282683 RepID=A0A1G7HD72_9RHOB|nr:STING domain-containing protein [Salipiger thiooxidans]SDE98400.1 hypothetical protein SAMN04488105_110232 [Salipiger thiooxidans]